jgi:hypothetical protein
MHLNSQPKPLRDVAPSASIPSALDDIIIRLLAKKPAERFQSARELRKALEDAVPPGYKDAGVSGTEPTMLAKPSPRTPAASRLLPGAIIVAAGAMLLGNHLRTGAAARKNSVVARADGPSPSRERAGRSSPDTPRASASAPQINDNMKPARASTKKTAANKAAPKKVAAKKDAPRNATAKKPAPKKAVPKKTAAKKAAPKRPH